MLCLRRFIGEEIIIRGPGLVAPITVVILGIDRGQVRLGFEAPRTMSIVRSELIQKYAKLRCDAEAQEAADRESNRR